MIMPNCLLVRCEDDFFNDSLSFSPEYTHQVFGEKYGLEHYYYIIGFNLLFHFSEVIFGYRNLKVQVRDYIFIHRLHQKV